LQCGEIGFNLIVLCEFALDIVIDTYKLLHIVSMCPLKIEEQPNLLQGINELRQRFIRTISNFVPAERSQVMLHRLCKNSSAPNYTTKLPHD